MQHLLIILMVKKYFTIGSSCFRQFSRTTSNIPAPETSARSEKTPAESFHLSAQWIIALLGGTLTLRSKEERPPVPSGGGCQASKPITFQSRTYFCKLWATTGTRSLRAIITSWRRVSRNFKQKGKMCLILPFCHFIGGGYHAANLICLSQRAVWLMAFDKGKCRICGWRKGGSSSSSLMGCNKVVEADSLRQQVGDELPVWRN